MWAKLLPAIAAISAVILSLASIASAERVLWGPLTLSAFQASGCALSGICAADAVDDDKRYELIAASHAHARLSVSTEHPKRAARRALATLLFRDLSPSPTMPSGQSGTPSSPWASIFIAIADAATGVPIFHTSALALAQATAFTHADVVSAADAPGPAPAPTSSAVVKALLRCIGVAPARLTATTSACAAPVDARLHADEKRLAVRLVT
jgi:hypothetical protein